MKKLSLILIVVLMLTACAQGTGEAIKVYTRDSASGTREAFESIIGLEAVSEESAETSGNGDMATQVGQNKHAIGYVSLSTDFEANNIKAVNYENVAATNENVLNQSYLLARPFSYVTRAENDFDSEEKQALVKALIAYLSESKEGRAVVVSAGGIADVDSGKPWAELKKDHPIVNQDNSAMTLKTGGSTSVEKTFSKAVESFIPLAGNFKFEPNHTGSGDGFKRTLGAEKDGPNAIDIGFASRAFKTEEDISSALLSGVYSLDAVVVVVHKDNDRIENLDKETLRKIFSGEIKSWSDLKA
ncbi:MAG TPA: substrate-binding domain-containing protein [Erysipelothrix sp.]